MLESSGLNHELLIGASFKVGKHDTTQFCSKGRPDLDTLKDPSTSKPQLGEQCQLHLASSQFAGSMVRLNREYCVKHGDHGLIYPSPFGGAFLFVSPATVQPHFLAGIPFQIFQGGPTNQNSTGCEFQCEEESDRPAYFKKA